MLGNQAQASTCVQLLKGGEKADTAAASTTTYVSVAEFEGFLACIQQVGTVTAGTIVGKLVHADDAAGTNVADITGATFTSVGTSTDESVQKISVPLNGLKPYIGYVGTIATGPAIVGVSFLATNKYV